jgi:hypothetical protein
MTNAEKIFAGRLTDRMAELQKKHENSPAKSQKKMT